MAKHTGKSGKGRFRRYLKGRLDETLALGTLGAKVVISANSSDVVTEKAFLSSVKATWSLGAVTDAINVGPVEVGIAHSDYSSAEIEEYLENSGSWQEEDMISQEIGKRKIRSVGLLRSPDTVAGFSRLNDGKPITTKAGWIIQTGQGVRIWAYNMGSVAFATTDPQMQVQGHANLWPR